MPSGGATADFAWVYGLSKRETEVTAQLPDGKSNAGIAEELSLFLNTVKR